MFDAGRYSLRIDMRVGRRIVWGAKNNPLGKPFGQDLTKLHDGIGAAVFETLIDYDEFRIEFPELANFTHSKGEYFNKTTHVIFLGHMDLIRSWEVPHSWDRTKIPCVHLKP